MIFLPPAFMRRPEYSNDPIERRFYHGLAGKARSHGLTYLGTPFEAMHPPASFFNTDYHLGDEARAGHTELLIGFLGRKLEDRCTPRQ